MKIQIIDHRHPLLPDIIIMGKQNAKTLGLFPRDAYTDHARKKWIFGAVENEKLVGYVLFRITHSKQIIYVTQLCVKDECRGKGVAQQLLDQIRTKYGNLFTGIGLSCRQDYAGACRLWEKYGFKAVKNVRSRSKEERYLIKWFYDFGNKNLFSSSEQPSYKVEALLDSNIIMKLSDEPSDANQEALALCADWLTDESEYFYAPEIFNEILRDADRIRAEGTRNFLHTLKSPQFEPGTRDQISQQLETLLPGISNNDKSDRLQLAECIAGNIEYFITLDKKLLDKTDQIFEIYSVRILRPADFILFIDHTCKPNDYRSLRFAGANYEYAQLSPEEIDALTAAKWLNNNTGEKKHVLLTKLTNIISEIQKSTVRVVKDSSKNYLGYFAAQWESGWLKIKVIRVINTKISEVLFQQLVRDIIMLSIEKKCPMIEFEEVGLAPDHLSILETFGFRFDGNSWKKLCRTGLTSAGELFQTDELINSIVDVKQLIEQFKHLPKIECDLLKLSIERQLSPVKFQDIDVPIYIIPIRPYWASQLFDHNIANHSLFGAKAELTWNRENIYYRNVNPVSEIAPGRILWYASSEPKTKTGRESSIIAYSYLDEVHIGPAKTLYRKFKNYGIYEWKDILDLTNNNPDKQIKALKFIDTEVFKKVVPLSKIQKIFLQNQKPANTFASPVKVSLEIFNSIYKYANP